MVSNREAVGAYPSGRPVRAYGVDHDHPDRVVRRISPWAVLAGAIVGFAVVALRQMHDTEQVLADESLPHLVALSDTALAAKGTR